LDTAYHVISREPLIITVIWDIEPGQPFLRALLDRVKPLQGSFILSFWWTADDLPTISSILQHLRGIEGEYGHRFYLLANSREQQRLFWEAGAASVICNPNALVDERIFTLQDAAEKKYDAVYNAQMARFKRHQLAAEVERLALITYFDGVNNCERYYLETQRALPGATWLNRPWAFGQHNYLDPPAIARYLGEARTGLCLSRAEGCMYASIEYLLCGLPVVSTRSRGGREEFFDQEYVRIVESTPRGVREGVEEMIDRRIDPARVRRKTLEKMRPHRDRLMALIQHIHEQEGHPVNIEQAWSGFYVNKLLRWQDVDSIRGLLSGPP